MKKIYAYILSIIIFSSCGDMIKVENESMVQDPYLNQKTDSVFYALGIAQAMQQLADQYFFIGEMRGELVKTNVNTNTNLRELADFSATTANAYDSAYVYYKVINNCNYYLANRDTMLYVGNKNVVIDEYAAVAAWRAWAYLQLARTYGAYGENTIPFFTYPLTKISQVDESQMPRLNFSSIVEKLAPDLEKFSAAKVNVPTFGTTSYAIGNTNWGQSKSINPSKLFVPVDVVLGEMYLEDAQYLKAAKHYQKYLCENELVPSNFNSVRNENGWPEDYYANYNTTGYSYNDIYTNSASPADVITYIPMAVNKLRGQTTTIPLTFGYDYYATDASSVCPRVEKIQIEPSKAYHELTDSCDYYYYPRYSESGQVKSYPATVKACKKGDGRANYGTARTRSSGRNYILNRDASDTTKIYVGKMTPANIILYRTSTIYLHLAEALNRMGYPDAAFAILKNGISTYLEDIVAEPDAMGQIKDYRYISKQTLNLLTYDLPFLGVEYRTIYEPKKVYGIHNHGGGAQLNARTNYVENGSSLSSIMGSRVTAVGSQVNTLYLPKKIIGAKLREMESLFNITVGTTINDTIAAMELVLSDEYAKEFAFEGTRFYDMQRMARHLNESGIWRSNFGSLWFSDRLKGNSPTKSLLDSKNWYLPF